MKNKKRVLPRLVLCCTLFVLFSCSKKDNTSIVIPQVPIEKKESNISYGPHEKNKMDVYFPKGYNNQTPVVFLFHAGGFYEGAKEEFAPQAEMFCQKGFIVVNANYRLVETTGLFNLPPTHVLSSVRLEHIMQDAKAAVNKYKEKAAEWETGTSKMYFAGHSAGAILSIIYVNGDWNKDKEIKAAGNWAGNSDLSNLDKEEALKYLSENELAFFFELIYRWIGKEPIEENALYFMAYSAYWLANLNGGMPTISVMPENNDPYPISSKLSSVYNVKNYHQLLNDKRVKNKYIFIKDEHHGLSNKADSWKNCIHETAKFFLQN